MQAPSRWLRLLCFERGAVLWLPGLWVAAALVLFAILQAAAEHALYNNARDLKVALGPLAVDGLSAPQAAAFEAGLRQGLAAQRELTLLSADPVRNRAEAMLGTPLPREARPWMRATRGLNVSYFVVARAEVGADGVRGEAELWQVADERRLRALTTVASDAAIVGRALGDSVAAALFTPRASPISRR